MGGNKIKNVGQRGYEINYAGYDKDNLEWVSKNMILGRIE